MIKFIYGTYGTGKTTELLKRLSEDTKKGIHSFLIIPDQEALQFERLTLSEFSPKSQLNLEILGFSRLYNRVCREYGGLSYHYLTKPMRSLVMWKILNDFSDLLKCYDKRSTKDMALSDALIDTVNEFKANGITPSDLDKALSKLPKDSPLADRIYDISWIYSNFDNFIAEKYSDSADDLSKLRDLLKKNPFFKSTNVYIDSFYSFTKVQHQIIEEIFKAADNVTVTIPLSAPETDDISTEGVRRSEVKLISSAERCGGYEIEILTENLRTCSPCLSYLSKNLWRLTAQKEQAPELDGSIVSEICANPYAEAEAVAAHILELLRAGERCRDIVVIARDCDKYRGIIDTALAKSNIPYFMAQKSDLCSMPAIKFILAAFRIKKYNWQKQDIIAYVKTGMCNVDQTDANLFEEYVNTWNIHSHNLFSQTWTMNPDGITESISPRGEAVLCAANRVREKIVEPLERFFICLDAAEYVPEMCKATYQYMLEVDLEDKLLELSKKAAQRGDAKQAREFSKVYGVMLNTLADVAQALDGETADTEEFMHILRNVFDKTEIGSIPTSIDEVTIGSANMLRVSNPKYAFVIGLCEGEFPATVNDSGLLSSTDRKTLSEHDIDLSSNNDIRASDELMYIHRAFSAPSEKLFVFTHSAEMNGTHCFPSLAFNRIEKLFKDLEHHTYKLSDLDYLVPSPKNAASIFRSEKEGQKKQSLKLSLEEHIPSFANLAVLPTSETSCNASTENVRAIMGDRIYFSATSFEKYVKCPFNYYCSNLLKLREKPISRFAANNVGSFVHHILETLIKHAIPKDESEPPINDETLIELADKSIEEYLQKNCPPSMISSKRMRHLYDRLKTLALLLTQNTVKEFSKSEFKPIFFELKANGYDNNPSPLVFALDNGTKVSIHGTIDRVDVYKAKDGNVYIRVVDYKTGAKNFSLSNVEHGINLQMLLYLFTLCRSRSAKFRSAIGLENGKEALPAGVVYLSTAIQTIDAEDYSSSEKILSTAEDKLARSGLLLEDNDILRAMNRDLDEKFIFALNKRGNSAFASSEKFINIYNQLEETVLKIATELQGGKADADPLEYGGESPCKYCASKPICRKEIY